MSTTDMAHSGRMVRAMLTARDERTIAAVLSVDMDTFVLDLLEVPRGLQPGDDCSLRVFFQGASFTLGGRVIAVSPRRRRASVAIALDFAPEVVETIDALHHALSADQLSA